MTTCWALAPTPVRFPIIETEPVDVLFTQNLLVPLAGLVRFPVMDNTDGDAALSDSRVSLEPVRFALILRPELLTANPPFAAADVPPPTKDAVIAAFVIRATSTFWSIVTVKLLE